VINVRFFTCRELDLLLSAKCPCAESFGSGSRHRVELSVQAAFPVVSRWYGGGRCAEAPPYMQDESQMQYWFHFLFVISQKLLV
jgi:hypothetical protein